MARLLMRVEWARPAATAATVALVGGAVRERGRTSVAEAAVDWRERIASEGGGVGMGWERAAVRGRRRREDEVARRPAGARRVAVRRDMVSEVVWWCGRVVC
jgi:hypothetical protein